MLIKDDLFFDYKGWSLDSVGSHLAYHLDMVHAGRPPKQDGREFSIWSGHLFQVGMLMIELKARFSRREWRSFLAAFFPQAERRKYFEKVMTLCKDIAADECVEEGAVFGGTFIIEGPEPDHSGAKAN